MAEQNQIMAQKTQVTVATFRAKFQSKREVYLLLTLDCRAFLPHQTTVTI